MYDYMKNLNDKKAKNVIHYCMPSQNKLCIMIFCFTPVFIVLFFSPL